VIKREKKKERDKGRK